MLFELHVRDAVHQQSADTIAPLIHRDRMTAAVELIGGGKSRGAGADDGDLFPCPLFRRHWLCPAFLICRFDDIIFIGANRDRIAV